MQTTRVYIILVMQIMYTDSFSFNLQFRSVIRSTFSQLQNQTMLHNLSYSNL